MRLKREQWRLKAVVATLSGFLFSLFVSAVVLGFEVTRLPPGPWLETAGGDLTMQVFQWFGKITDPRPEVDARRAPGAERYAFIDVDKAACERFSNGAPCPSQAPVPEELVLAFVRAVNASGAKVVIVDWRPEDPTVRADFMAKLRPLAEEVSSADATAGPWILAPVASRPTDALESAGEKGDRGELAVPPHSRLRLVSTATSTDPDAMDGVIRSYPLLWTFTDAKDLRSSYLPTAPFLAAMLASGDTAFAASCALYVVQDCTGVAESERVDGLIAFGKDKGLRNRIFYTLPALSGRPLEDADSGGLHRGRWDYYRASDLLDTDVGGTAKFIDLRDNLEGRIVALGCSRQECEDLHPTPIGRMTGPEIILNATRAIAEFAAIQTPAVAGLAPVFFSQAWERLLAALIGTVFFFPAWLWIFWMHREGRPRRIAPALGCDLGALAIFLAALTLALAAEFSLTIFELSGRVREGVLVNGLVPILALGLEGFAEAAREVNARFEALVLGGLVLIRVVKAHQPTSSEGGGQGAEHGA